jgi:hypothetical protein
VASGSSRPGRSLGEWLPPPLRWLVGDRDPSQPDPRQVRRYVNRTLRELGFDSTTFTVEAMIEAMERRRGRPCRLRSFPQAPPAAMLISVDEPWPVLGIHEVCDILAVAEGLSPVQQRNALMHEAAHGLCGHRPAPGERQHQVALIVAIIRPQVPDLPEQFVEQVVASAMHRDGAYNQWQEAVAEQFPTAVVDQVGADNVLARVPRDPPRVLADGVAQILGAYRQVGR